MLDIQGDKIMFEGIEFATISPKVWPTLRDEACELIEDTERDIESELQAEYERGYEEAAEIMQHKIDALEAQIEKLEGKVRCCCTGL